MYEYIPMHFPRTISYFEFYINKNRVYQRLNSSHRHLRIPNSLRIERQHDNGILHFFSLFISSSMLNFGLSEATKNIFLVTWQQRITLSHPPPIPLDLGAPLANAWLK